MWASACLRLGPDWLKPVVTCHAQDEETGSVNGHVATSTSKRYDRHVGLFPRSVSRGGLRTSGGQGRVSNSVLRGKGPGARWGSGQSLDWGGKDARRAWSTLQGTEGEELIREATTVTDMS